MGFMIMCQYWFINCDQCTKLSVKNRGNWVWNIWELSALSSQFFWNSKTILKLKSLTLKKSCDFQVR